MGEMEKLNACVLRGGRHVQVNLADESSSDYLSGKQNSDPPGKINPQTLRRIRENVKEG